MQENTPKQNILTIIYSFVTYPFKIIFNIIKNKKQNKEENK
jgi:hypothetical protein